LHGAIEEEILANVFYPTQWTRTGSAQQFRRCSTRPSLSLPVKDVPQSVRASTNLEQCDQRKHGQSRYHSCDADGCSRGRFGNIRGHGRGLSGREGESWAERRLTCGAHCRRVEAAGGEVVGASVCSTSYASFSLLLLSFCPPPPFASSFRAITKQIWMKPIAVVRSIPGRTLLHPHDLFAVSISQHGLVDAPMGSAQPASPHHPRIRRSMPIDTR